MTRTSIFERTLICAVTLFAFCAIAHAQDYIGIDSCSCHSSIIDTVLESQHPDKVLSATEILTTDNTGESAATCADNTNIFDSCTAGYATYIEPFNTFFHIDNVEYALGAHWKQRFMTRTVPTDGDTSNNDPGNVTLLPEDKFVVMGAQWNIDLQRWQNYHGPLVENNWYDTSRQWNTKCGSCHTTGFNPITDVWVERDRNMGNGPEHGVTCEGCHGPASSHADNIFSTGEKPPFPENFPGGKEGPPETVAEGERRLEICGQCHGRGASAPNGTYGFPFKDDTNQNYVPGEVLSDYYTQTTSASSFWPDGTSKKHHQQYIDFRKSSHWTGPAFAEKLECITCHDPHNGGTILEPEADLSTLCQDCHTDKVGAAFTAHAGGGGMTDAVMDCNDCHMPFTAKSINAYDIRAHTFLIIPPANTLDPSYEGMPNSCTSSCHFAGAPQGFPLNDSSAQNALYNIRAANGGSNTEVGGLTVDWSGTDLALFWGGSIRAYRVYTTGDASSALVGVAHWHDVSAGDLDGDLTNTAHIRPPTAAPIEFFLVVEEGPHNPPPGGYVGDGPWGHYSR